MGILRPVPLAALLVAIIVPLREADIERALTIGRASDSERARFHSPYIIPVNDATVEQLEIITEFRRVVLFAEDRIRMGDHMFGLRQAEEALRPWRGKLTVVARLRFHPLNTYVTVPAFSILIDDPPLPPIDTRRTAINAPPGPKQRPGAATPIIGAVVEADFDAAAVGEMTREVLVVLDGKQVAGTVVDFARLP